MHARAHEQNDNYSYSPCPSNIQSNWRSYGSMTCSLSPTQWLSIASEYIPDSSLLLTRPYLIQFLPSFSPVTFPLPRWSVATLAFLLFLELTSFRPFCFSIFHFFTCHSMKKSQLKCLPLQPQVPFTTMSHPLPHGFYFVLLLFFIDFTTIWNYWFINLVC